MNVVSKVEADEDRLESEQSIPPYVADRIRRIGLDLRYAILDLEKIVEPKTEIPHSETPMGKRREEKRKKALRKALGKAPNKPPGRRRRGSEKGGT